MSRPGQGPARNVFGGSPKQKPMSPKQQGRVGVSLIKRQKGCPETVFEFLKRDSDVVFDAEHGFRICFSIWRTKSFEIVISWKTKSSQPPKRHCFPWFTNWRQISKIRKIKKYVFDQIFVSQKLHLTKNLTQNMKRNLFFDWFCCLFFRTRTPIACGIRRWYGLRRKGGSR